MGGRFEGESTEPSRDEPGKTDDDGAVTGSLFERFEQLTLVRIVLGITVVALLLRLVSLGVRTAHWDEARVAYWAYFYTDTGALAYHWEEHGPFVQLVAGRLFDIFGVNDLAARLPVAIVGGMFPLAALLYREHLRRSETVVLALLLALNPILLYYSRFMRSDVLVAAFAFVAFGLLVRFYDTRRGRYLLVSGVFLGLSFASKENAIVYVLTWLGAAALVADQFLHSPASTESGLDRLRGRVGTYREVARRGVFRVQYLAGFVLAFLVTIVVTFAPRGGGIERRLSPDPTTEPVTLGAALTQPTRIPALVDESLRAAYEGYVDWFAESEETTLDTYITFVGEYVQHLVEYAPVLLVFALLGVVLERYARDDPRPLVMFMAYCGIASLVGYPLGSHIQGDWAWISTHVVVPLAVPAAVGLAWLYREGKRELRETSFDPDLVVVPAVIVLLLWFLIVPLGPVYLDSQGADNGLAQYAQPHDDLNPMVQTLDGIADEHDGDDVVLFYGQIGEDYDRHVALTQRDVNTTGGWQIEPTCSLWSNTQPLNWYFAVAGAEATCERDPDALADSPADGPPMIIAVPDDDTLPEAILEEDYERETYYLRNVGREVVVYTHTQWTG